MGYADKEKQREYQKNWYKKNKEKLIKKIDTSRKKKRLVINELKDRCSICGEDDIICLDFHHVDEKNEGISRMIQNNCSLDLIIEEVKKCIVVCKNCHFKIHRNDIGKNRNIQI